MLLEAPFFVDSTGSFSNQLYKEMAKVYELEPFIKFSTNLLTKSNSKAS